MATKRRRSDDSQLSENTRLQSADSGEQLGTGRGELHIGPGFVQQQPAQRDRADEGGAVLLRRTARFEEGAVDPLDVDTVVLNRLSRVGDLQQFAGSGVRVFIVFVGRMFCLG